MKKILISSDPHGNFNILLPKIQQLHNKNKFSFMLIVGSVCPSTSSKIFKQIHENKLKFPLSTYFIDNSDMSFIFSQVYPNGGQIVPNFHYLGNSGYKQIDGIKIAYISGNSAEIALYKGQKQRDTIFQYSRDNAKHLIDTYQNQQVNILLTNQWAQEYLSLQGTKPKKNQVISQICYELSPRYHIAASSGKYLRLPAFKGRKGNPTHFINAAQIKQSLPKDKYLVAIQINPQIHENAQNIAQNPLVKSVDWNVKQINQQKPRLTLKQQIKMKQNKNQHKNNQRIDASSFIMFEGFPEQTPNYQITQFMQKWGQLKQIQVFKKLKGNKKTGIVRFANVKDAQICLKDSGKYTLYQCRIKFEIKQQNQKYRLKDCFLCIQNDKFDSNLLVHKSKFCYVSVDKGPITNYHFQIVPINHINSTGELEPQQQQEISQIRTIFKNYFISLPQQQKGSGNKNNYTFICLQRYMNLATEINHAILHCIPVQMSQTEVLSKFKSVNYNGRFGFEDMDNKNTQQSESNYKNQSRDSSPYYIIIQINNHRFIKNIDRKDKKFQQGRQIICQILEKPQRLNWRDCEISAQKIKQSIIKLQKALK